MNDAELLISVRKTRLDEFLFDNIYIYIYIYI